MGVEDQIDVSCRSWNEKGCRFPDQRQLRLEVPKGRMWVGSGHQTRSHEQVGEECSKR